MDPAGAIANSFGVASPPTTFVLGADGRVVEELVGPVTATELDRIVAPLDREAQQDG
jgi:thioredoxin-like negative regulator of GroEL